ncbi:MAG: phage shock protein A [Thermonema sp.]|uniref:PspA/IM30 family protein n=1 Tax=Thermonema sp. TaxID=2231181 RepID=UPI0021DBF2C0|nr:PspA/IM30 family protein [Thermonema sp.]GIV40209.1 MAG: phage shock protein A [Thermonema sp.]
MGIFKRIADIFKANVNDALDKAEDPAKMIKLMVIEMQESLTKATASLAKAMAQERKLKNEYEKYLNLSEQWKQKAAAALQQGREDLARQALQKKALCDQNVAQYKQMYEAAAQQTAQLKETVDKLKAKLDEARAKESMLLARSETAKAQKEIVKQIGGVDTSSIFAKFDKFEEKILEQEAEAQAYSELASDNMNSLEDEFKQLNAGSQVDDELAKLKAELNAGNDNNPTP